MALRLFAPAGPNAGKSNDSLAVGVWIVVFVVWLVTWIVNATTIKGELKLPDVPTGIMVLLAALPVSKAITYLRRP